MKRLLIALGLIVLLVYVVTYFWAIHYFPALFREAP